MHRDTEMRKSEGDGGKKGRRQERRGREQILSGREEIFVPLDNFNYFQKGSFHSFKASLEWRDPNEEKNKCLASQGTLLARDHCAEARRLLKRLCIPADGIQGKGVFLFPAGMFSRNRQ